MVLAVIVVFVVVMDENSTRMGDGVEQMLPSSLDEKILCKILLVPFVIGEVSKKNTRQKSKEKSKICRSIIRNDHHIRNIRNDRIVDELQQLFCKCHTVS